MGNLTRKKIQKVIKEYDEIGEEEFLKKYGYLKSRTYWLFYKGKRYASKAVYHTAKETPKGFRYGGKQAVVLPLRKLGFLVPENNGKVPAESRERVYREVEARLGQQKFRAKLLDAYDNKCAISQCIQTEVLQAAHIEPYRNDASTNKASNGILLRADIHTLFDLGYISINPDTMSVVVSRTMEDKNYISYSGKKVFIPAEENFRVKKEFLISHYTSVFIA